MQIKINNLDGNPLNRGEFKYEVDPPLDHVDADDQHAMLHLVKPKHRADFKSQLKSFGIDPYSMRPVLTVHDMRSRIYITKNKQPFMSISFDRADAAVWWAKFKFVEIEPELNEIPYTEGDAETRQYMEKVLRRMVGDIRTEFPFIEQNLTPKYNKSFSALSAKLPFFPLLVKTGLNNNEGMRLAVGGALALVVFLGYVAIRKTRRLRSAKKEQPVSSGV
jgi:hypothetical protein